MIEKFKPAFSGIVLGLKDAGIRLQFILASLAVIAGFIMHLSSGEWIAVVICIALVISSEILNTCIEKVCDLYSTEEHEQIRVIKDLAAGAVFAASAGALITALIILVRHLS